MHHSKRYVILAGAGLAATVILSGCGTDENSSAGSMGGMGHGTSTPSTTSGSVAAQAGDVMFAQMMIPHHQQAVEMADLALQNGSSSKDVTNLARQIKAAQDPEIQTMNRWLREWNAPTAPSMSHGSGGMMSDDDMTTLTATKGAEFDRLWLTMMIQHHQGAVTMAKQVLATTANADVKAMAQAIVDGQNKEIATMRGML